MCFKGCGRPHLAEGVRTVGTAQGCGRSAVAAGPANLNANLNRAGHGSSPAPGTAGCLARNFRAGFCSGFWFHVFRPGSRVFR